MHEQPFVPAAGSDSLLPFYDLFTRLLGVEGSHRRLLDQASIRPGARVLEIGCGTGNLAILAKRLNPAAQVIGIDPDPNALARARRKAQRGGVHVQFDPAYSEQLPFPDACFDRVLSAFMLHHLRPDAKVLALREACRVLKPGGSLHLADFDEREHSGLHHIIVRITQRPQGRRHWYPEDSRHHHTVLATMRDAGFEESREVAHQTAIMGRFAYYMAVRPPSTPSAAA